MTSLRRFFLRLDLKDVIQNIFIILNIDTKGNNILHINEEDDCPICYEKIINTENVVCEICNNFVHLSCIETWLKTNDLRNCPICRSKWKFEIDIIEKTKPIYIELDEYSLVPKYISDRNSDRNSDRLTVRGSITGSLETEETEEIE